MSVRLNGIGDNASPDEVETSLGDGDDKLHDKFKAYAAVWSRETRHISSLTKMVAHPAYEAIINLGEGVLPFLFEELRRRPNHWLVALNRLTNADPVPEGSTFMQAVEAWLEWGRKKGFLRYDR